MNLLTHTFTDGNGNKFCINNGHLHRIDGPACEYRHLTRNEWYINGNHVTTDVEAWLAENQYTWPFDESTQMAFQLRFT